MFEFFVCVCHFVVVCRYNTLSCLISYSKFWFIKSLALAPINWWLEFTVIKYKTLDHTPFNQNGHYASKKNNKLKSHQVQSSVCTCLYVHVNMYSENHTSKINEWVVNFRWLLKSVYWNNFTRISDFPVTHRNFIVFNVLLLKCFDWKLTIKRRVRMRKSN